MSFYCEFRAVYRRQCIATSLELNRSLCGVINLNVELIQLKSGTWYLPGMNLSYLALGAEQKDMKMRMLTILILTKNITNRNVSVPNCCALVSPTMLCTNVIYILYFNVSIDMPGIVLPYISAAISRHYLLTCLRTVSTFSQ